MWRCVSYVVMDETNRKNKFTNLNFQLVSDLLKFSPAIRLPRLKFATLHILDYETKYAIPVGTLSLEMA
jgi:hypothetical protein